MSDKAKIAALKKEDVAINNTTLLTDIKNLIANARSAVAQTVNAGLTMLYSNIGKQINDEILKNKRDD